MKIIIIIEKYGGYCNRFFQSLHYHAFSIENNIYFFNPSLLGLLKFDNSFYYFWDKVNNFCLSILARFIKYLFGKDNICFYLNENNYIKIVNSWNFRENCLTKKYHKELKEIYDFKKEYLKRKPNSLVNYLEKLKKKGKYLIGLHIRRDDYKVWNDGKYYFSDEFYEFVIKKIRQDFVNENKDPFIIVVSDEKISSKLGFDFFSKGSWKEDQIILQTCDMIIGPPSTFTMWASYISQIPLIKITSKEMKKFSKGKVCEG